MATNVWRCADFLSQLRREDNRVVQFLADSGNALESVGALATLPSADDS